MNTTTSRYRALRCDALSSDLSGLHFVELDAQAPGPGEVAVRMRAAALKHPIRRVARLHWYAHRPISTSPPNRASVISAWNRGHVPHRVVTTDFEVCGITE